MITHVILFGTKIIGPQERLVRGRSGVTTVVQRFDPCRIPNEVSKECLHFLDRALQFDKTIRATAQELLDGDWLAEVVVKAPVKDPDQLHAEIMARAQQNARKRVQEIHRAKGQLENNQSSPFGPLSLEADLRMIIEVMLVIMEPFDPSSSAQLLPQLFRDFEILLESVKASAAPAETKRGM